VAGHRPAADTRPCIEGLLPGAATPGVCGRAAARFFICEEARKREAVFGNSHKRFCNTAPGLFPVSGVTLAGSA